MASDTIERLHYFQHQFLGAEDFEAQQAYHRDMRRRHNLGDHTWGIATGLELVERPAQGAGGGVDVFVQPGMAIDGYGREILLFAPTLLDPALFEQFAGVRHLEVWINYHEEDTVKPQPGFEQCQNGNQFERVLENFVFAAGPQASQHADVVVDGQSVPVTAIPPALTIPEDESVPFQELPDEETSPRWLIRLGSVQWDGPNRRFIAAAPAERLAEGRRYVGVVASDVLAPPVGLRLRPRATAADKDAADFAAVEGRLRVDGRIAARKDVLVQGGRLSFQNELGLEENAPLWMKRRPGELRIHTGEPSSPMRLSIGPGNSTDENGEQAVLAVNANDTVDIPTGKLQFGAQTRQMVNLFQSNYGIGVQNQTLYYRSDFDFCWFKSGAHNDARSNPGGGALMMKLDEAGELTVNGNLVVNGNLLAQAGQNIIRVETRTLAVTNSGTDRPGSWSVDYSGMFSQVYTVFAVLQGHSLWNYAGNTAFTPDATHHAAVPGAIPQHVFVRVDAFGLTAASGVVYASESDPTLEVDNTILFTVVIMGRSA
jgi:hypothetical protein